MSIWDFLHPGFSGDPSGVVQDPNGSNIGHFQVDQLGHTQHIGADGMPHGSSHVDALGTMHHQGATGAEVGTSHVDSLGNVHHLHNGHEVGRSYVDALGIGHHANAFGQEVASSHIDPLGHLHLDPRIGAGALHGSDPFSVLNDLLKKK